MKKNFVRYGIIFALTAVLLFFFFRSVEWKDLLDSITDINLLYFIPVILLCPLHLVTRSLRWRYLILPEKKDVSFYNLFAGQSIGFTVTLTMPGRLGELVKPLYLARKENISQGFALGTVVVERLFDIIAMVFLLAVFLLARPLYGSAFPISPENAKWLSIYGLIGLGFDLAIFLVVLSLHFFKAGTLRVIAFCLRPLPKKWSDKVHHLIEEFIEGLRFFRSLKDLLRFFALSLVVWLAIIGVYWLFFMAFHEPQAFYKLIPFVFLTMVGAAIPTPGMVGGFHYFSKEALLRLYFPLKHAGLAPDAVRDLYTTKAVSMTLVIHATQVIMTWLVGFVIILREGLSFSKLRKMGGEMRQ